MKHWLIIGFLLIASSVLAEEHIVFLTDTSAYSLGEDGQWTELTADDLKHAAFRRRANVVASAGGVTRTQQGKAVEVWDGAFWTDSGLFVPPDGTTYEKAHIQSNGNTLVELGGNSSGFLYRLSTGPVIISEKQEWASPAPEFKQLVNNPASGDTFFGLAKDGSIWHLVTPTGKKQRQFIPTQLTDANEAESIHVTEGGQLLVEHPGGQYSLAKLTGDSLSLTTDVTFPAGKRPSILSTRMGGVYDTVTQRLPQMVSQVAPNPNIAKPKKQQSATHYDTNDLESQVIRRRNWVHEWEYLARKAKERGLRVWLFGGAAYTFGHYVKNNMDAEQGKRPLVKEKFDYELNGIFIKSQDVDLVVTRADGGLETPEDIAWLQFHLDKKYPYKMQNWRGEQISKWEVRGLRASHGTKDSILGNWEFMNQHSDSGSNGVIELTEPPKGEPHIRDLRHWDESTAPFLTDIRNGEISLYHSKRHFETTRGANGNNPEIFAVIRYLAKVFQVGASIPDKSRRHIERIIGEFNPHASLTDYAKGWIEKNAKKLFLTAQDVEEAWNTLEELGLREKLIKIRGNTSSPGSLAFLLNKEPLRTKDHRKGYRFSGLKQGKTAGELGITEVAHATPDYEAWESITRSHSGHPNVFISRTDQTGEVAYHGSGFYTAKGSIGWTTDRPYNVTFKVDPSAVQGVDFNYVINANGNPILIWRTADKLTVVPQSASVSPELSVKIALGQIGDEIPKVVQNRISYRLLHANLPPSEAKRLEDYIREKVDEVFDRHNQGKDYSQAISLIAKWDALNSENAALNHIMTEDELLKLGELNPKIEAAKRLVRGKTVELVDKANHENTLPGYKAAFDGWLNHPNTLFRKEALKTLGKTGHRIFLLGGDSRDLVEIAKPLLKGVENDYGLVQTALQNARTLPDLEAVFALSTESDFPGAQMVEQAIDALSKSRAPTFRSLDLTPQERYRLAEQHDLPEALNIELVQKAVGQLQSPSEFEALIDLQRSSKRKDLQQMLTEAIEEDWEKILALDLAPITIAASADLIAKDSEDHALILAEALHRTKDIETARQVLDLVSPKHKNWAALLEPNITHLQDLGFSSKELLALIADKDVQSTQLQKSLIHSVLTASEDVGEVRSAISILKRQSLSEKELKSLGSDFASHYERLYRAGVPYGKLLEMASILTPKTHRLEIMKFFANEITSADQLVNAITLLGRDVDEGEPVWIPQIKRFSHELSSLTLLNLEKQLAPSRDDSLYLFASALENAKNSSDYRLITTETKYLMDRYPKEIEAAILSHISQRPSLDLESAQELTNAFAHTQAGTRQLYDFLLAKIDQPNDLESLWASHKHEEGVAVVAAEKIADSVVARIQKGAPLKDWLRSITKLGLNQDVSQNKLKALFALRADLPSQLSFFAEAKAAGIKASMLNPLFIEHITSFLKSGATQESLTETQSGWIGDLHTGSFSALLKARLDNVGSFAEAMKIWDSIPDSNINLGNLIEATPDLVKGLVNLNPPPALIAEFFEKVLNIYQVRSQGTASEKLRQTLTESLVQSAPSMEFLIDLFSSWQEIDPEVTVLAAYFEQALAEHFDHLAKRHPTIEPEVYNRLLTIVPVTDRSLLLNRTLPIVLSRTETPEDYLKLPIPLTKRSEPLTDAIVEFQKRFPDHFTFGARSNRVVSRCWTAIRSLGKSN